jgi:hypothetical protein
MTFKGLTCACIILLASCGPDQEAVTETSGKAPLHLTQNPFSNNTWGNGFWRIAGSSVDGNYSVVPDPETGLKLVQQFTVREGQCGTGSGWDDCKYNSGRYEFVEGIRQYKPRGQAKEMWYSWEVRLKEGTLSTFTIL